MIFQSTRSARSATETVEVPRLEVEISIHALRKERDGLRLGDATKINAFQSTRSARSATCLRQPKIRLPGISIHALRKERDLVRSYPINIH